LVVACSNGRLSCSGFPDGRRPAIVERLLRNSTIFAAQKSGLGQCSGVPDQQKAPFDDGRPKARPDCLGTPNTTGARIDHEKNL
jgi:hypothetical protein